MQTDDSVVQRRASKASGALEREKIVKLWKKARLWGIWLRARLSTGIEHGASAVEYGIMIALIAAVVLIAVLFLGNQTSRSFSCTASAISTSAQC
jgi:pilus assembly protein Flp/PilA